MLDTDAAHKPTRRLHTKDARQGGAAAAAAAHRRQCYPTFGTKALKAATPSGRPTTLRQGRGGPPTPKSSTRTCVEFLGNGEGAGGEGKGRGGKSGVGSRWTPNAGQSTI